VKPSLNRIFMMQMSHDQMMRAMAGLQRTVAGLMTGLQLGVAGLQQWSLMAGLNHQMQAMTGKQRGEGSAMLTQPRDVLFSSLPWHLSCRPWLRWVSCTRTVLTLSQRMSCQIQKQ
jgi:hypothetical protein